MGNGIDIEKLSLTTGGSGAPAVFIHGFGSSKFTWRHVCRGVADICTYYAIDLPGSGDSPAPAEFDYSLENLADVVVEFIVKRDLQNVTLVGASLGGGLALLTMLRQPERFLQRIRSLCVVDGISYPQQFPFFVGLLRVPIFGSLLVELFSAKTQARAVLDYCYFDDSLITTSQVEEYASYFRRPEVRSALLKTAQQIDTQKLYRYLPKLKTILAPSLLIWGKQDRVVPVEVGRRLARELTNSQMVVIDRCGHMPQEERPEEVISAIKQFILDKDNANPHL